VTDNAPPLARDVVHPEIAQGFGTVPPSEEVNVSVVRVETHGMPTAPRGYVSICVDTMETFPLSVGPAGLDVGVEEACGGCLCEERLGFGPVALEDEGGVQGGDDGVFKLDLGTGEDGSVGRQEAPFAKVFEDLSEDDSFSVL
jgi:hypothetical protein